MIGTLGPRYAGPRKMKPRGIIARCELIPGWQVVHCRALYDGSLVWYHCDKNNATLERINDSLRSAQCRMQARGPALCISQYGE